MYPQLLIYGPVFSGTWNPNSSVNINKFLDEHKEAKQIDVRINSPGGIADEGIAIYNSLKKHKAKINIYIDGMAASVASLIAMAGDNIFIHETSRMLIHNPSNFVIGDEHELRKEADNLTKLKESVMTAYMTKVTVSEKELSKIMDEEVTYTAKEALEKGFATNIVEEDVPEGITMYKGALTNETIMEYLYGNNKQMMTQIKKDEGVEKMTLEELQQKNPTLFNQVMERGAERERERIRKLDELHAPGREEMLKKAKYETMSTDEQIAVELMKQPLVQPEVVPNTTILSAGGAIIPETPVPGADDPQEKGMTMAKRVAALINKEGGHL